MRYISDEKRILVGTSEFVSVARRRISPTLPFDDDEPLLDDAISLPHGTRNNDGEIFYDFERDGLLFRLVGRADLCKKNEITLSKISHATTEGQRKSELTQCRAEGFIIGKMLADIHGYSEVELTLNITRSADGSVNETKEVVPRKALDAFFNKCTDAIMIYAEPEIRRVSERLPSMKAAKFPYESVREGQLDFIKHSYKTLAGGGTLFACAPTGTGKTVSVIYPAIKALGNCKCDKVFYLTPKTTTANAAKECIELFTARGVKARAIILTSKEKSCPHRLVCREDPSTCEMAKCNRIADATIAAYNTEKSVITINDIREIATRYTVCPHELELSYSELCDIVICDVNYLFDPSVYIRRFFTEGGNYAFLIDEAHNLPERGREMYSAEMSLSSIDTLLSSDVIGAVSQLREVLPTIKDELHNILLPYVKNEMRKNEYGEDIGGTHLSYVPSEVYSIMARLSTALDSEERAAIMSRDNERKERIKVIKDLSYRVKKVCSALDFFDTGYRMFIFIKNNDITFKLYCIDTGKRMQQCINKGKGTIFFSATLSPLEYYRTMLSDNRRADIIEAASPFDPSQLSVSIVDKISTRYSERARTLPSICRVIAATLSARRGHYLVFAPSFEYAEALYREFSTKYPRVQAMLQTKDMTAAEKSDFLARFSENENEYLVGFSVMGGIYSEGIDLTGNTLIGAIIIGIGIPTLSYEREVISEYFEEKHDAGKLFAYVYPGMNRVFQAAGRVIRREDDKGVIVLIDDRFADPIYKKSIPELWKEMQYVSDAKALREQLDIFWNNKEDV